MQNTSEIQALNNRLDKVEREAANLDTIDREPVLARVRLARKTFDLALAKHAEELASYLGGVK